MLLMMEGDGKFAHGNIEGAQKDISSTLYVLLQLWRLLNQTISRVEYNDTLRPDNNFMKDKWLLTIIIYYLEKVLFVKEV